MGPPLQDFVLALQGRKSSDFVFNPWYDTDPMDALSEAAGLRRLRLYDHLNVDAKLILIGEAPGYQGCHFSGVPFTSERLLLERKVPRTNVKQRITLRERPWSEPSATIVWGVLHDLGLADCTVMWNAFPFHPHRPGEPLSNRTPNDAELKEGVHWLRQFLSLHGNRNAEIIAVGRKAQELLLNDGHKVQCVRHPANGGATEFRKGLEACALGLGFKAA